MKRTILFTNAAFVTVFSAAVIAQIQTQSSQAQSHQAPTSSINTLQFKPIDASVITPFGPTQDGIEFISDPNAPAGSQVFAPITSRKKITIHLLATSSEKFPWNNFGLLLGSSKTGSYVGGYVETGVQKGSLLQQKSQHENLAKEEKGGAPTGEKTEFPMMLSVDTEAKKVTFRIKDWQITQDLKANLPDISTIGLASYHTGAKFRTLAIVDAFEAPAPPPPPPFVRPWAMPAANTRGAKIDETQIKRVLVVNGNHAKANDKGTGAQTAPFKTIGAAFEVAKKLLVAGTPTKVLIMPGTYREGNLSLVGKELGGKAGDTLFIMEGAAGGKVVVTGSVAAGWEPKTWTLVDAQKKIYRHDWNYNWGPVAAGWEVPGDILQHRSEQIFINDKPLQQAILEKFEPTNKRDLDAIGGLQGGGSSADIRGYRYNGYQGPETLAPGQFGVAELGPNDTRKTLETNRGKLSFAELFKAAPHATPNSIFIRLPEGMSTLESARIEVADKRKLMTLGYRNNTVVRNITFERTAHYPPESAIQSGWFWDKRDDRNWILENVQVRQNRGAGWALWWVQNLDVRNCNFSDNGNIGSELYFIRNARIENSHWLRNGGFMALNFAGQNVLFNKCSFNENRRWGLREDHTGVEILLQNCQFNRNGDGRDGGGMFLEIMPGPWKMQNCEFVDNKGESGLNFLAARNITIENCLIANNQNAQIQIGNMIGRTYNDVFNPKRNWAPGDEAQELIERTGGFHLINTRIKSNGSPIFGRWGGGGIAALYEGFLKADYTGRNNQFWTPDANKAFNVSTQSDDKFGDLEAWQAVTGQDKNSVWKPIGAGAATK